MAKDKAEMSVRDHIHSETKKNIVINFILNGAISYALFHSLTEISASGEHGYSMDLLITGFLLPAILGGIFIGMFRAKYRKKEILPTGREGQAFSWLLPYNPWLAALWIGILATAIAVPWLLGVLALLNIETFSPISYAITKAIWAAALAGLIVPIAIGQGLRAP